MSSPSACIEDESSDTVEPFITIFDDDSDTESMTDDRMECDDDDNDDDDDDDEDEEEENQEVEFEFLDLYNESNAPFILGTMYNEEVADPITVNRMLDGGEGCSGGNQEPELNRSDRTIEYNISHEAENQTLVNQPQSDRGTDSPRDTETLRGTVSPKGKVITRGSVTPQGKGIPRNAVTSRSKESPRGKGISRVTRKRLLMTDAQWKRGDRLIEVYGTDDDVPKEIREMITQIDKTREASRMHRVIRNRALGGEDQIDNVDDGGDEMLFAEGENTARLEWSSMGDYSGNREAFLPEVTGPTAAYANAYEAFRQYWDDDILAHIVTETNRNGTALAHSFPNFAKLWYETNIHEILILFSFWIMLGVLRMPTTSSCFTLNPLLQVNIFRHMFSRSRYEILTRAFTLHFNDGTTPSDDRNLTNSFGPLLDHLNSRFKESYIPSQNICIDESLLLWKGRLSFRQYIKTKAARFGVKTFELCESSSGYLWSFFIYLGANTDYDSDFPPTLLKSTSTVLKLVKPLFDKGYTVHMDNWFNSPLLAKYLKTRKTDCVGTLRANRRNVPPIIPLCKLHEGQFVARHSGDVVVMAYQDRTRKVATISTYHGTLQNLTEQKKYRAYIPQYKPQAILDYNKGMGGVDRKDSMLEPYLMERKRCARWNMKVIKRLLNCSILNSRILLQGSSANPKDHLTFRLELVETILLHHLQKVPKPKPVTVMPMRLLRDNSAEKHWPKQTEGLTKEGRHYRRRCTWCSKNKRVKCTTFLCSECDVPLCIVSCFQEYHEYRSSRLMSFS